MTRRPVQSGVIRKVHRGHVLLIVDYAETRPGLERMLHQVSADTGSDMRVLLLARQAGEWWQRLGAEPMAWETALDTPYRW